MATPAPNVDSTTSTATNSASVGTAINALNVGMKTIAQTNDITTKRTSRGLFPGLCTASWLDYGGYNAGNISINLSQMRWPKRSSQPLWIRR